MRGLRSLRDVYENSGLSVRKLRNTHEPPIGEHQHILNFKF